MIKFTVLIFYFFSFNSYGINEIGVAWKGKSSMAERVYKSFLEGLGDSKKKYRFEKKTELKTLDNLEQTIREFEKTKSSILLFRSNAFKLISKKPSKLPTFLGAGNNPKILGVADDAFRPIRNATGVTYYIPLEKHYKIFKSIFPKMSSLALMTERNHPGSLIEKSETKIQCEKYKLNCDYLEFKSSKDLLSKLDKMKRKYDAVVIGAQDLIMKNTSTIVKKLSKTPVLAYASKPVEDGALIGFVASDEVLGKKLAKSFLEFYEEKKKIHEIPFKRDDSPQFQINVNTAKGLGIEIPFEIINAAKIIQ